MFSAPKEPQTGTLLTAEALTEPMGLRLERCGDLLTIEEYTRWSRNGSVKTTYNQIHLGKCLVPPHAIKPKPVWRRIDCEAWLMNNTVLARQRSARVRGRMRLAATQ